MKSTCKVTVLSVFLVLTLIGCGGGGSSDSEVIPNTTSLPPSTSSPNQISSLAINPLSDLGLTEGQKVCFSIKSYNNTTESSFSDAICSQIKNENMLTLSWNKINGDITGYYVYYGTTKNNATNYLADVIQS